MTIPDLLERLKTINGWYLAGGGAIRRYGQLDIQCPLSAACDRGSGEWATAADVLGMSNDDAMRIVVAADNDVLHMLWDPVLSQLLLAVTVHRSPEQA